MFSRDRPKRAASLTENDFAQLGKGGRWRAAKAPGTLKGHSDSVHGVFITPDGRRAVSTSKDHTLRVWDLESGKELALLTAENSTASCAVSLDGRTIVAGDATGNMHILETEGFGPDQHIR